MDNQEKQNYTYMVACSDGSLYTGWTVAQTTLRSGSGPHNEGKGARYTKSRRPVELVWHEAFPTKEEAMRREYEVKQLTRREKEALIRGKGSRR